MRMQYENLFRAFATLGSSGGYFRKEVPSARCILESSDRCPNILTVAPPNNLVLPVPCRPPIIPVCGRTYHAVCLKSRWGWLGTYLPSNIVDNIFFALTHFLSPYSYDYMLFFKHSFCYLLITCIISILNSFQ